MEKSKKNKISSIAIIVFIILDLIIGLALSSKTSKDSSIVNNTIVSESTSKKQELIKDDDLNYLKNNDQKPVSIGKKGNDIYLIYDNLNSYKLFTLNVQKYSYSTDYILKDGKLFITDLYADDYLVVIDLKDFSKQAFTKNQVFNETSKDDIIIYYKRGDDFYYKNLKIGEEYKYDADYTKNNYLYYVNGRTLFRKNIDNGTEEQLLSKIRLYPNFVIGKEKIYYRADNAYYYYNTQTQTDNIIDDNIISKNGVKLTNSIAECNNSTFVYSDDKHLYIINEDNKTKNNIYEPSEDEFISDVSMLTNNVVQISITTLGDHGTNGIFWQEDKWLYYNINTNEFLDIKDEGFDNIKLLDIY